nr:immunoglobulin light chain junction region [Macaca mulatta]
WQHYYSAPYSF